MFLQSMITTLPTPAPTPTLRHLYQLILFEREYYVSYEGQCRIVREGSDANCRLNRKQETSFPFSAQISLPLLGTFN